MKVILTQEVKGKGGEGDVIDVARGYAVNYLFPRKMAIEASAGNLKQLELRKHNIQSREQSRLGDAESVAAALEGKTVTVGAKVGDEGRLYGSITSQMIEEAIASQLDVDVDRKKMDVHGHIKETGPHAVIVHVYRDVKATITVNVVPEGTEAQAAAAVVEPVAEAVVEVEETVPDEAEETEDVLEETEDVEEEEAE